MLDAHAIDANVIDNSTFQRNLAQRAAAAVLVVTLLLSLVPLPNAAAMSSHTWRAELGIGLFLLGALGLGQLRFDIDSPLRNRILLLMLAFTGWGLISGTWATSFASVVHHTIIWIEYALLFAFASGILRTIGRRFFITAFVWYVCIIGLVTLSDYLTLPDFRTLEGVLRTRYSAYGELTVAILPILWLGAAYQRRIRSWILAILPAGLGWISAMLSLSKGVFIAGIIGFGFAFVTGLLFGKRTHRNRMLLTATLWLALTCVVQIAPSLIAPIPSTVDYISGKADPTRETTTARILVWRTTLPLISAHWLVGVGADNYGIFATKGREAYRSTHPTDPPDEPISDFLFDRAHNEPLQVLIELGIVGLALFAAPLAVFLWVAARAVIARKRRLSLFFWGACGGMLAFAASSMLSSFSFRIVQNGAAFIIVFAFAVYELSKAHKRTIGSGRIRRVYKAIATLVLATLIAVLSFKAFAEYEFAKGDQMPDRAAAAERYRRALRMDPDYVAADYRLSRVAYDLGDSEAAAAEMRRAIDEGMGVVLTYSNLADCYEAARDQESEFRTFDEALRVYPRSVFLRIRYSIELEKASLHDASRDQLAIAGEIDSKQANGWHELLTLGSTRAFYDARENHAIAAPADLLPQVAVYQYLDKGPWK